MEGTILCPLFAAVARRYSAVQEVVMRSSSVVVLAAAILVVTLAAQTAEVPYPEGYRDWRHVKSMVIGKGHPLFDAFGGIHHIYANDLALKGYAAGKFPDGSVLVFDLLEARAEGGATIEGARKVLGVMHKDMKRWAATGGWGFEGFKGDSRTDRAVGAAGAAKACFECHTSEKGRDYVFSRPR
jgi:hypothetical protein